MSCGTEPPNGPYRWKKRVCSACTWRLRGGAVTWAGAQAQVRLQVPTCRPGLVKWEGVSIPPPAKKWASVAYKPGQLQVCRDMLVSNDRRGKRWEQIARTDLEKVERTTKKKRFLLTLAGIGCAGAYPIVSASTDYNRFKALCGRMFRQSTVPRPSERIYQHAKKLQSFFFKEQLIAPEMTVTDWLLSMPRRRRRALLRAAETYAKYGLLEAFKQFSSFIKTEALPGFDKDEFGDLTELKGMIDRLINGPHDVTHVVAGRRIKPLCKRLKELWSWDGPLFYGSAGPRELHNWLQRLVRAQGTYFWCDYSMYDVTHSNPSWDFVESLYREAGIVDPDFWKVMEWWRKPEGTCGPFKFKANVMNASGRDDTAFANAILNGFAAYISATAAWKRKSVFDVTVEDLHSMSDDMILSVCGDDSLGRLPLMGNKRQEEFARDMAANIAKFGFEAKLCLSNKLSDCVYLGMRPYPTRKGWFWGKTIGRATYKMGYVVGKEDIDNLAHITGVADMHVLCSSHVPVLSDLAEQIVKLRTGAKRNVPSLDPEKPWEWTLKSGVKYDDITLAAVVDAYNFKRTKVRDFQGEGSNLTLGELQQLILEIRKIDTLPYILNNPTWRKLIWADDL